VAGDESLSEESGECCRRNATISTRYVSKFENYEKGKKKFELFNKLSPAVLSPAWLKLNLFVGANQQTQQ
jgi:hypothetical protein